ncbi:acyltransferase family protein [Phytohabitans kaempferiae]|uniref:Acyltransferase n=1 Tax=Phytohabitans kaempferiae TaxID=1620943 RepID=A0ABV6M9C3_9ACTN
MRPLWQLAERTPASRDRYVDLLRAMALLLVVLGHWLVSVVGYDAQGRLTGRSALDYIRWAYPLTWLFQVMPVFFMVGGFANATSLASHRRRGEDTVAWLLSRAARLVRPTTTLFLVLAAAALVARPLGVSPTLIRTAVWTASIPLWFLAAYLIVVLLAPLTYALHRRFGVAVPLVLLALVALGDVARLSGPSARAAGNYLFGWLLLHQVGYFWRDGRLRSGPRWALPLLLGGVLALVLLTVVGPYPVSMIDIAGTQVKNASPPSLALLATAAAQLGLIMLCYERARRWLGRRWPWRLVVAANSVLLTIFLWHMSAVIVLAAGLSLAGLLPTPKVDTTFWWLWRVPWLLLLSLVLAGLVAIFGRIETRPFHRPDARPGWLPARAHRLLAAPVPRVSLTVAGYLAVVAGLIANSTASRFHQALLGIPLGALAAYLAGALVLRLLRSLPARRTPT